MAKKYKITNYGNTRTVYIKGQSWEISKGASITIDDEKVPEAKEVAVAFERLPFVDVEIKSIKRSKKLRARVKRRKKKAIVRKKKKKVTTRIHKKTKQRKTKGETK